MPIGRRVQPDSVDLERFKQFVVIAKGGLLTEPCAKSGEVLRFTIGRHVGRVSQRKNGKLTFCGIARPMLEQMRQAQP